MISAVRVRTEPCARFVLACLSRALGPIALIHSRVDDTRGAAEWCPRDRYRPAPHDVAWARASWGMLYVRSGDLSELCGAQICLEATLLEDPGSPAYTEIPLHSTLRPLSDSEIALQESIIAMRADGEARAALARIGSMR